MGSAFDITVVANDSIEAIEFINDAVSEITRIERRISSWDPDSETSAINRNAGVQPVAVSEELFLLITRCVKLSKITSGAFDISYASMDKVWKYDGSMTRMPSEAALQNSVKKVGYQHIVLDPENNSVYLKVPEMKIGFGAVGKGYAADKAKELLQQKGVQAGIINASGDMNTWGKQPNGSEWKVALTNPMKKENAFAVLPLQQGAVVTSGNYERYVTFNGTRYSHIIDPRTGYPAVGIISATVFAPKAEIADALATALFVMGIETGIDFVNQLPNIECIVIDEKGVIFSSTNIQINTNALTSPSKNTP